MQRWEHKIPPPLIALGMAMAMWAIALETPGMTFDPPGRIVLAVLCALLGIAVVVSGIMSFVKARTTVNPIEIAKVSAFVHVGMFRVTRNPMYLGMAVILLGWAVFLGNLAALAGIAAFVAIITRIQIIPEERVLAQRFGEDYAAYRRRVRRWI
jgi:protein-S-isoprenylcysteine O-methyltransferase Ste14